MHDSPRPPRAHAALAEADPPAARGRTALLVLAGVTLVALVAGATGWLIARVPAGTSGLALELRDRGRVAIVGNPSGDLARMSADGAQLVPASSLPGMEEVLGEDDDAALDEVLSGRGVAGILVDGRRPRAGGSISARLSRYESVSVLRGVHLTPVAGLYLRRRGLELSRDDGDLLARAARQILGGARLPNVRSFPEPLRRSRSVEVLVMIRHGGRARLWRSARGGSMARAMITASSVARDRWIEREAAMGGSLDELLPSMTVEVLLLEDDGTLADRGAPFLDRAITPEHGVAFEVGGSWHYLRPEETVERGGGSAVRAYAALFEIAGERTDSLHRPELRLYRIVTRLVGTSAPSGRSVVPSMDGPPALEGIDGI